MHYRTQYFYCEQKKIWQFENFKIYKDLYNEKPFKSHLMSTVVFPIQILCNNLPLLWYMAENKVIKF